MSLLPSPRDVSLDESPLSLLLAERASWEQEVQRLQRCAEGWQRYATALEGLLQPRADRVDSGWALDALEEMGFARPDAEDALRRSGSLDAAAERLNVMVEVQRAGARQRVGPNDQQCATRELLRASSAVSSISAQLDEALGPRWRRGCCDPDAEYTQMPTGVSACSQRWHLILVLHGCERSSIPHDRASLQAAATQRFRRRLARRS